MTTGKTTNIKSLLRDECLPALNQSAAYFSMADVRAWLQQRGVACPPPVLRDYLSQFMRSRLIHDAGRGWYSRIASPCVLNAKPVARLARQVEQAFPLLDFACWSTEQVRSFGHLLLARFVAFIHTERDAMASVADRLRDAGYDIYLNPRGAAAREFATLLTDRDRTWSQSELVDRTNASSGLVSRIVQHLISQGFIEKKSAREFHLKNLLELVDAWVKADDVNRRTTTTRYTTFGGSPIDVARQLHTWAGEQSVPIAFTQWIAAWLRHPYTEPVVTSAYVARLPEAAALDRLGLRPVTDAGKVWLLVPDDEGVFLETLNAQGLPLATDAQIYLDLQRTGLRGPDQAAALRNWEGFCRK